uniref:Uncharacterized protein n=1 Tax=Podoviridae sp. ctiuS14 TaxID=2827620 RepID=A0A8S5LM19_9CAUD|nr:MAG TPA: hypothetical protein [Podoviridae sp. ctiuS14]
MPRFTTIHHLHSSCPCPLIFPYVFLHFKPFGLCV